METKELFEDLKSGVRYAAETIGTAGKTVCRRSKIALEEADTRRALRDALAKLGRSYYELRTSGSDDFSSADELMEEIASLDDKLAQIQSRKEEEKKVKTCPLCGRKNEKDASFCSGCGEAL